MKKKVLSIIGVVAVAIAVAVNINATNISNNVNSDVTLANVEALAFGEGDGSSCESSFTCSHGGKITCTGYTVCGFIKDDSGNVIGIQCDKTDAYC